MIQPFQKDTKKQIGHEYISGEEQLIIAEMIKELKEQLERLYENKRTLRQIHTKMHACVKATFTVVPNLPPELRVGVFKNPLTYPAWIRFSNANTIPQHDKKKDIRGIALKLMNVPGEKLLHDERYEQTQDFLLMSSECFFSKDLRQFRETLKAATSKNKLALLGYFLNPLHFNLLRRIMQSNIPCMHPFEIPYWSTQPYQYGDQSKAVKYFIRPAASNKLFYTNKTDYNYLRMNMARTLIENEVSFDFCTQFQTDADKMPIEDPTIKWNSPFIKIAEITIPVQVFDSPQQMEFGDNLSFTPWHSLPEHRPLGSFNRARKRIYQQLSKFRHKRNNVEMFEPSPEADFFESVPQQRSKQESLDELRNIESQAQ